MLKPNFKDKLKSSLLFDYLSKKYPESGVEAVKKTGGHDNFGEPCRELEDLKSYFDAAAALIKQPVEYKRMEKGYCIDVVFAGHWIKFINAPGLFFSKTNRRTVLQELFKGILESECNHPVHIFSGKWFFTEGEKFELLSSKIPELKSYEALKTLDKVDTKNKKSAPAE